MSAQGRKVFIISALSAQGYKLCHACDLHRRLELIALHFIDAKQINLVDQIGNRRRLKRGSGIADLQALLLCCFYGYTGAIGLVLQQQPVTCLGRLQRSSNLLLIQGAVGPLEGAHRHGSLLEVDGLVLPDHQSLAVYRR